MEKYLKISWRTDGSLKYVFENPTTSFDSISGKENEGCPRCYDIINGDRVFPMGHVDLGMGRRSIGMYNRSSIRSNRSKPRGRAAEFPGTGAHSTELLSSTGGSGVGNPTSMTDCGKQVYLGGFDITIVAAR